MNKDNWLKWNYENNGPFAVIKTGVSHAIYWGVAIFIFSIFVEIGKFSGFERLAYFSFVTIFTTSLFLCVVVAPLILIHAIHYKIFKKILLNNIIEKSIIVALTIILAHFVIIYFAIDYLIFSFNWKLSPIEFTYVVVAYMLGLIKGFTVFHNNFYQQKKHNTDESANEVVRQHISNNKNYF